LPTLVAFALFPGWSRSVEILGAFIGLDLLIANIVEPLIIGPGIDVSPVVLLISAMYWSWIWGLPGLLLATPLTGCLKVAGDYIPALRFLSILLGAERVHEDYHDYYRLLLELDQKGARAFAVRYCDRNGLQRTFYDVILPAPVLMGEERVGDRITPEVQQLIVDTSRQLIAELGSRFVKPPVTSIVRVLGVMAPGDIHDLGLLTLIELSRQDGVIASFAGPEKSSDEICDMVKLLKPDFLFLSCMTSESLPAAVQLTRDLRSISSHLTVIAGGSAVMSHSSDLIDAGCSQVCANSDEARRSVRRYTLRRALSRTPPPQPALRSVGSAGPIDLNDDVRAHRL
jgi:B12 binding domain/AI-2E family transporter